MRAVTLKLSLVGRLGVLLIALLLPGHGRAEADGPDFYDVTGVPPGDEVSVRESADVRSAKVGAIPSDGRCLRNVGCVGGLTFEEFTTLPEANKRRIERERTRWCQVEYRGSSGWVAGRHLREAAHACRPSFDCGKVAPGSIEELICKDDELAALDRTLAEVYAAAAKKAADQQPPLLGAEQRGWLKGRDECWKDEDKRGCVERAYTRRTAALQARYRLVTASAPVFYACDGDPKNEVVATFFETAPPTLVAERGDQTSLMFLQPDDGPRKYHGRNESLVEGEDATTITWGYDASEMRCTKKPR